MAKVPLKLQLPMTRIVQPLDAVATDKTKAPRAPARALVPLTENCEIHYRLPIEVIEKILHDRISRIDPNDIQVSVQRKVRLMQTVVPLDDVRPKK